MKLSGVNNHSLPQSTNIVLFSHLPSPASFLALSLFLLLFYHFTKGFSSFSPLDERLFKTLQNYTSCMLESVKEGVKKLVFFLLSVKGEGGSWPIQKILIRKYSDFRPFLTIILKGTHPCTSSSEQGGGKRVLEAFF